MLENFIAQMLITCPTSKGQNVFFQEHMVSHSQVMKKVTFFGDKIQKSLCGFQENSLN